MIFKKLFLLIGLFITLQAQPNFKMIEKPGSFATFSAQQEKQTWVGLYKKGTNNAWGNVLAWDWVKNSKVKISRIAHFKAGDYQARLFFNNSYVTAATIDFKIGDGPGNTGETIAYVEAFAFDKTIVVSLNDNFVDPKDWIGVFKKGAPYTLKNIEAWSYIKENEPYYPISIKNPKGILPGKYDVVYFHSDTYQTVGPVKTFTVEPLKKDLRKEAIKSAHEDCAKGNKFCTNDLKHAYEVESLRVNELNAIDEFYYVDLETDTAKLLGRERIFVPNGGAHVSSFGGVDKKFKGTPIIMTSSEAWIGDPRGAYYFYSNGVKIKTFSWYEDNGKINEKTIKTLDNGKKLYLEQSYLNAEGYGIWKDTYDISDPTKMVLINRDIVKK